MSKKTPLQQVTEQHGSKEKLADKLVGMVDRGQEEKAEFRGRLLAAPNSKLLRLFEAHSEVKERFGSRDGLVDDLLKLMNRAKDKDYRDKLRQWSPVRLRALHRQWEKKTQRSAKPGVAARG